MWRKCKYIKNVSLQYIENVNKIKQVICDKLQNKKRNIIRRASSGYKHTAQH